ncbi:MAG: UDP-N-acetylglucosamine 1-carboxyvinyltransferase [Pseudomonadota bacterium]
MDKIKIGKSKLPLKGSIKIGGSKNAALPLMAASILTDDMIELGNLPHLGDISTMINLLIQHGVEITINGCDDKLGGGSARVINLFAQNINNFIAPYHIVCKMRASILVLGPLLARFGYAKVSLPGGCAIGTRPIDLHLKALEKMGATINLEQGYIEATAANGLTGAEINFSKISVGATENILMAACLASGTTIINNAACEPEVTDLANCLVSMGADIEGISTNQLIIKGVEKLHGTKYDVISDRIEAGSYAAIAAVTGGDLDITGIDEATISSFSSVYEQLGVVFTKIPNGYNVHKKSSNEKLSLNVDTQPYPGFPTDLQAPLMVLMAFSNGQFSITENIFENRFMHVPELCRMGADIKVNANKAIIKGDTKFKAAEVMATDLRASICLIIAGLIAEGQTIVNRVYHLDRGYEWVEDKLSSCGAIISRVSN